MNNKSGFNYQMCGGVPDLVCFSHLRWDFVYQRPQHLLSRCARERRVFFVEEPVFESERRRAMLEVKETPCGVEVALPRLPVGLSPKQLSNTLRRLVEYLFRKYRIFDCILWYYTPMALPYTSHIDPLLVVYDCMDELSGFRGAPPELRENEAKLMARADVVFTGGISLYEAKAHQHNNIYPFPSSIDVGHFAKARDLFEVPADERGIPRPRLGFAGVIDERMDLQLIEHIAEAHPEWSLVLIGPVAKVSETELPRRPNIHYLGPKPYESLPSYMAGWDVAVMPFAHNDSTRYISPTKTPEYLAAGRPVVSTSIRDVVRGYGKRRLVAIADAPGEFISEIEKILRRKPDPGWLDRVDQVLSENSWDATWKAMMGLIQERILERKLQKESPVPIWHSTVAGERDV